MHQVVRQVVRALERRAGRHLPVVLVGHSQGSSIAIRVAAEHPNTIDALVTTGFLHRSGPAADLFLPALHPAAEDPRFAGGSVPEGYLTTEPGLRVLGYDAFHADPRIVARDDAAKSTTTVGEVVDFATEQQARLHSRDVTQPVLAVVGTHDVLFCAPGTCAEAVRGERTAYPAAASMTGRVVPDAGHNLALQRNAPRSTRIVLDWIDAL